MSFLLIAIGTSLTVIGQTNKAALKQISLKKSIDFEKKKSEALQFAKSHDIPIFIETDEVFMELMSIDKNGQPQYYTTENVSSSATISTNKVNPGGSAGLNLDGGGMTVHEWDGGAVLDSHQEFGGRITQVDGVTTTHYHATHVGGTMIASGVVSAAKGMAPAANLSAYDWNSDEAEMATAGSNGALVSNHSYGYANGWSWTGTAWTWYGSTSISTTEDYAFGFYDTQAKDWDVIAKNAPYYLIVKSSGNDRGDGPTGGTYPQDGPYDCIGNSGNAKNILTVGAVEDVAGGYSSSSDVVMSSFSSWGPSDDGRIKPDICTNGVSLYSTDDDNDTDYTTLSGTSMASPSATGSLILLQEHFQDLNGAGNYMLASTLKALVIHTADEAGPDPGPDYMFGWGLMNIEKAAARITEDQVLNVIDEQTLNNGNSYSRTVSALGGEPLVVTIVWTDVEGTPLAAQLDPADPMIVNELDMRITEGSNTYYPWSCDRVSHSAAATRNSENNVDNVEMVTIDNPVAGADYNIVVDHDGTLSGGSQTFSIIISGIGTGTPQPPVASFIASSTTIGTGESLTFTDQSGNGPTSWNWTFVGGTPASSTDQNPLVTYNTDGTYDVTLTVTNAQGSDTKTITDYITVSTATCSYCSINYTNISDDYISNVVFNGIDNSSSSTNYSDFTSISTDVAQNSTHTLSVDVTVNGNWVQHTWAWFDWNGNCDFTDDGEAFDLGATPGTTGTHTLTAQVTIPDDAVIGNTRMRIVENYSSDPTSCQSGTYGEGEDYSIVITGEIAVDPPSCVTTVAPADGGVNIAIDVNLEWNNVANADGYKIYFGTDNPPANIENGLDVGSVTTYNPANDLDNDQMYFWKVVPYNTGGDASGCSTWSYTTIPVVVYPPSCASVVAPVDGSVDIALNTNIEWTSVAGADGYRIYFGTDNPPTNLENGLDIGVATSYNPVNDLDNNQVYYWEVIPYNSAGDASGYLTWSFTTIPVMVYPPDCATIVSPVDGGIDVALVTNLEWASVADADGYKIYFGTDNPPTNLENGLDVGNVTLYNPVNDLTDDQTYYWMVVPYNASGDATGCFTWLFNTVVLVYPPTYATEIAPVDGDYDVAIDSELEWDVVADADGYIIYFGTDNPPSDIEDGTNIGNVTVYTPSDDLDNGTTYFWEIVPYNTAGDATGCSTWSFTTISATSGVTELGYDDFESSWGIWTDGGGDCARRSTSYSPQENYSIDIQDNSGVSSSFYLTNGMDVHTDGYVQIDIEFTFQPISMDNSNEDFWVEYYDGSNWYTVADFDAQIDFQNGNIYQATVSILESDYTFPTNMKIRFMCDASGNRDDIYVDEIRILASDQLMNSNNGIELIQEEYSMPVAYAEEGLPEELLVYPNPVTGASLTVSAPYEMKSIVVYNMMGEIIDNIKIEANTTSNINTLNLKSGIYLLRVESDEDVEVIRFIKH